MNEADRLLADNLKSEIVAKDIDLIDEMPFELFEKPNNKTTQLLASAAGAVSVDGRNRWFDYKFREPLLVTRVVISTSGYESYHQFEFSWKDEEGKEKTTTGRQREGDYEFEVNDLCKKVSFKPPSTWFSNPKITSVSVEGVKRENISELLDALSDLEGLKQGLIGVAEKAIARADSRIQEAAKAALERGSLDKEVSTLKGQQSRLKSTIQDLSTSRDELIAKNTAAQTSFESTSQDLKKNYSEIERSNERLGNLKSEIQDHDAQLKSLKGNINLFPTEIVEFVNQGSKNIKQYLWITAVPIILIAVVFGILIYGAADLSTIFTKNPDLNINAVVLSRLPYVTICLAIITASYKIARVFISEIMKINSQRLSLTKISIIAKDVSSAAEVGLEMSDEDIYRLRTDLKMQMLRDHLKEYISKDFKIELPHHIVAALGMVPGTGATEDADTDEKGHSLEVAVSGDGAKMSIK